MSVSCITATRFIDISLLEDAVARCLTHKYYSARAVKNISFTESNKICLADVSAV